MTNTTDFNFDTNNVMITKQRQYVRLKSLFIKPSNKVTIQRGDQIIKSPCDQLTNPPTSLRVVVL